jgi:hypothetical protein
VIGVKKSLKVILLEWKCRYLKANIAKYVLYLKAHAGVVSVKRQKVMREWIKRDRFLLKYSLKALRDEKKKTDKR